MIPNILCGLCCDSPLAPTSLSAVPFSILRLCHSLLLSLSRLQLSFHFSCSPSACVCLPSNSPTLTTPISPSPSAHLFCAVGLAPAGSSPVPLCQSLYFIHSELVQVADTLDQLPIASEKQKDAFFKGLPDRMKQLPEVSESGAESY